MPAAMQHRLALRAEPFAAAFHVAAGIAMDVLMVLPGLGKCRIRGTAQAANHRHEAAHQFIVATLLL